MPVRIGTSSTRASATPRISSTWATARRWSSTRPGSRPATPGWRSAGWRIAFTADTHSHADYVSGARELAADGAACWPRRGADLEVEHHPVDGRRRRPRRRDAAGHRHARPHPDHLAYLLLDDGTPVALFSGGSLMVGAVGRTDLLGDEHREELARELFRAAGRDPHACPTTWPSTPPTAPGRSARRPPGRPDDHHRPRAGRQPAARSTTRTRSSPRCSVGLGSFPPYFLRLPEINRTAPACTGPPFPTWPASTSTRCRAISPTAASSTPGRSTPSPGPPPGRDLDPACDRCSPAGSAGSSPSIDPSCSSSTLTPTGRPGPPALTIGHDTILGELDGGIDRLDRGRPDVVHPLVDPSHRLGRCSTSARTE